jgi:DNA gyrase subunit A
MGRATEGVRGIALREGDVVVGMVVVRPGSTLLVVTESGMGKRSEVEEYRLQNRGGKGVINMKVTPKTGRVVSIKSVVPGEDLMLITRNGVVNRQSVDATRVIGRATQGVRLVSLDEADAIVDVARVIPDDAEPGTQGGEEAGESVSVVAEEEEA